MGWRDGRVCVRVGSAFKAKNLGKDFDETVELGGGRAVEQILRFSVGMEMLRVCGFEVC